VTVIVPVTAVELNKTAAPVGAVHVPASTGVYASGTPEIENVPAEAGPVIANDGVTAATAWAVVAVATINPEVRRAVKKPDNSFFIFSPLP
jgi:hypothetical protein